MALRASLRAFTCSLSSAGARSFDSVFKLSVKRVSIDRKSTRLNSSHSQISDAVFCLKKKREGAGGGLDVLFPVAADGEREELEDLAAVVLVGVTLVVLVVVDPDEDLPVARDVEQHRA